MYWGVFWIGLILLFFSILVIIVGSHIYNKEKKEKSTEGGWWTIMIGSVFLVIGIALCIGSFFYHPAAKLEIPVLQAK